MLSQIGSCANHWLTYITRSLLTSLDHSISRVKTVCRQSLLSTPTQHVPEIVFSSRQYVSDKESKIQIVKTVNGNRVQENRCEEEDQLARIKLFRDISHSANFYSRLCDQFSHAVVLLTAFCRLCLLVSPTTMSVFHEAHGVTAVASMHSRLRLPTITAGLVSDVVFHIDKVLMQH